MNKFLQTNFGKILFYFIANLILFFIVIRFFIDFCLISFYCFFLSILSGLIMIIPVTIEQLGMEAIIILIFNYFVGKLLKAWSGNNNGF